MQERFFADFVNDYRRNARLVVQLIREHIPASELPTYQTIIEKLQTPLGISNRPYFPEVDPLMAGWYPGEFHASRAFLRYLETHPE